MDIARIKDAVLDLGAPTGTEKHVSSLPVRVVMDPNMGTCFQSAWIPDEVDIANILAGQPIILTVFGTTHPVVSVSVGE